MINFLLQEVYRNANLATRLNVLENAHHFKHGCRIDWKAFDVIRPFYIDGVS